MVLFAKIVWVDIILLVMVAVHVDQIVYHVFLIIHALVVKKDIILILIVYNVTNLVKHVQVQPHVYLV